MTPPPDRMTLTASIQGGKETVQFNAEMESLDEVLIVMERFIRAAGYTPHGHLTFQESAIFKPQE